MSETRWENVPKYPGRGAAVDLTPLEYGARVAWVVAAYGMTSGLSEIHRHDHTDDDGDSWALCGEKIGAPSQRLPIIRSLARCAGCDRVWAYQQRKIA